MDIVGLGARGVLGHQQWLVKNIEIRAHDRDLLGGIEWSRSGHGLLASVRKVGIWPPLGDLHMRTPVAGVAQIKACDLYIEPSVEYSFSRSGWSTNPMLLVTV